MSSTFENAGTKMVEYLIWQAEAAKNKNRPKWFSEQMGSSISGMLDVFSPSDASIEAGNLYREAKQAGRNSVKSQELIRVRKQMQILAAMTQAARRRYAATGKPRARTVCDSHRYEREKKIAAAGLMYELVKTYKDGEQQ